MALKIPAKTTSDSFSLQDFKDDLNELDNIKSPKQITLTEITASTTLALTHANQRLKVNSASAVIITVPPSTTVAFTIGDEIELIMYGAGVVSVVAGSGVTVRSKDNALKIAGQYAAASLVKIGTDEWLLVGALIA